MRSDPQRHLGSDTHDFFYLLRRPTFERRLPGIATERWRAESNPSAGFLPPVATIRTDAEAVRMVALDQGALRSVFVLGTGEAAPAHGAGYPPAPALDGVTARLRIRFDAADRGSPRGLMIAGREMVPTAPGRGIWMVSRDGRLDLVEGQEPPTATRFQLTPLEQMREYGGICTTLAVLTDPDALLVAWGNLTDVTRRLEEIGVDKAGVLGCGRHRAGVESLIERDGEWTATDLLTDDVYNLDALVDERSAFLFEARPPAPRVGRLRSGDAGRFADAPAPRPDGTADATR